MADEIYVDPILKKYGDLIQNNTKVFKRIYFGEPIRIGASELPSIILSKVDTSVKNLSNVEDEHSIRISFTVVTDVRETISDDKPMVKGINQLYDLMEGRQDGTYALKPSSLLGILRHNVELDVSQNLRTDLSSSSRVSYGMTQGKRSENGWAIEGMVEITCHFIQNR
jgi:hypothetical protein